MKNPTRLARQLAASIIGARNAYQQGYEANDRGKSTRACRFRLPWLREAWMKGWRASEKARRPAEE